MQPFPAFYLVIIEEYSNNDTPRLRAKAVVINLGHTEKKSPVECGGGERVTNILIEMLRLHMKPNKSEFLGVRSMLFYKHPL